MSTSQLREVQRVEVIPLVENVVEMATDPKRDDVILPRQWVKGDDTRPAYIWGGHGISILVRVYADNMTHQILYDTGPSAELLAHNVDVLGIDLKKTEAIVMSHGHWDHFGGLIWTLKEIGQGESQKQGTEGSGKSKNQAVSDLIHGGLENANIGGKGAGRFYEGSQWKAHRETKDEEAKTKSQNVKPSQGLSC